MPKAPLMVLALLLAAGGARAQMAPETPGMQPLAAPADTWFLVKAQDAAYVFDGATGEMQGLISNENGIYTPAIVTLPERREAYMVESFYARGVRGERSDVLTVVDMADLAPKAEIDIPDRAAALGFRNHIGILGDDRHLVVFNQTPAQSVSVVDVVDRAFAGEIDTPGCAVIMPTGERGFLMICGDGRLQLIRLDEDGKEAGRAQSARFFDVEKDAVFDMPLRTDQGWLLVSRDGLVYEVRVEGSRIDVAKPWPMQTPRRAAAVQPGDGTAWRPGGKQVFAIHRASGLLYALMHRGGIDTHGEPGTEVWVVDVATRRTVGSLPLATPATHILSSQSDPPLLYVYDTGRVLRIHDGHRLRELRNIAEPGPEPWLLQNLARHD